MRNYKLFQKVKINNGFTKEGKKASLWFQAYCHARYARLAKRIREDERLAGKAGQNFDTSVTALMVRSYPVLSILAPALTSHEGKIEFPGDPMALYHALSVSMEEVIRSLELGLTEKAAYNDLIPRWISLPDVEYRFAVSESGIRPPREGPLNTDETIWDPRVWNASTKAYLIQLLLLMKPKVVLISTTSPGHRYAIDIALTVKSYLPNTLIVMGGRHIDETMHFNDKTGEVEFAFSSTVKAMDDGRIGKIVDFLVSGEAYFSLDLLMKAISLAMDLDTKLVNVRDVVTVLDNLAEFKGPIPGKGLITAINGHELDIFPIIGPPIDLGELPSPYRHFAIRAHFPIFHDEYGTAKRTAHILTITSCPFNCPYCSESIHVVGQLSRFKCNPVKLMIDQILEYVKYGAEALFWDDSVFLGGNVNLIRKFCRSLKQLKEEAQNHYEELDLNEQDRFRLTNLEWGAQLTFDFMSNDDIEVKQLIHVMKEAGCSYLYFGIESMAESVMENLDKYKHGKSGWPSRVKAALKLLKDEGIQVGASVLFGLDGETAETIRVTLDRVTELVNIGLLDIVSPNIATYHPATRMTHQHKMEEKLDYVSLGAYTQAPYIFFEEAYPGVVSKLLSEEDIWFIHEEANRLWGNARNMNQMPAPAIPVIDSLAVPMHTGYDKTRYLPVEIYVGESVYKTDAVLDLDFDGEIIAPANAFPYNMRCDGKAFLRLPDGSLTITPLYAGLIKLGPIVPLACTIICHGSQCILGKKLL